MLSDPNHWHINKTVSVGNLLSTFVIAVSMLVWANSMEIRVEQNTLSIDYVKSEQEADRKHVATLRQEIKSDLRAINAKLDRLIERLSK